MDSEATLIESDITSSILGGNHNGAKRATAPKKQEENEKAKAKTPKAKPFREAITDRPKRNPAMHPRQQPMIREREILSPIKPPQCV